MDENTPLEKQSPWWKRIWFSLPFWGALIIGLCVLFPLALYLYWGSDGGEYWDRIGAFGDQYGTLNALFSGLAFAGVIIALHLQRKDLELQRDEMKASREEQERQTEIFQNQQKEAERQRFETSLNSLISMMTSIRDELTCAQGVNKELKGKKALRLLINSDIEELREWCACAIMCLRRIEMAELSEQEKGIYFEYLNAFLGDDELKALDQFTSAFPNEIFMKEGRSLAIKRGLFDEVDD